MAKTSAPAQATETRERIIAAATELIPRFTLAKVTMEDIARTTGIARQTVYKHFRNKDELIAELIVQELRAKHAPLMSKYLRRKPTAQRFAELFLDQLNVGMSFALVDPVLDPSVGPRMAELIFGVDAVLETLGQVWAPILDKYDEAGLLQPGRDRASIVRWITYQQFWLVTHPDVLAKNEQELDDYVEHYIVAGIVRSPQDA
ncbi:TetR/AcrR family transcriptional regulator [Antrihabitans stalactiti]|nr:TetR/AcrR family transcriptional regulator [Antrihabitans stalactiti]